MEGSWMTCKMVRSCCENRIETKLCKVAKILLLSQKYSKTNPAKSLKKPFDLIFASPVTFLTGDHVMQIGFGQISPSASSTL